MNSHQESFEQFHKQKLVQLKQELAATFVTGMLAHPTRYKPRDCDAHMNWHEAICNEAFDLADAFAKVALRRNDQERE